MTGDSPMHNKWHHPRGRRIEPIHHHGNTILPALLRFAGTHGAFGFFGFRPRKTTGPELNKQLTTNCMSYAICMCPVESGIKQFNLIESNINCAQSCETKQGIYFNLDKSYLQAIYVKHNAIHKLTFCTYVMHFILYFYHVTQKKLQVNH